MKRMMFNDRYGLTEAVLNETKTVTRRAGGKVRGLEDAIRCGFTRFDHKTTGDLWSHNDKENGFLIYEAPYKIGEIVAVAQSYFDALSPCDWIIHSINKNTTGWKNKMFVKATLCPTKSASLT